MGFPAGLLISYALTDAGVPDLGVRFDADAALPPGAWR